MRPYGSAALTTRHPSNQQKLTLTSPISGGLSVGIIRSRTKATELHYVYLGILIIVAYSIDFSPTFHFMFPRKKSVSLLQHEKHSIHVNKSPYRIRGRPEQVHRYFHGVRPHAKPSIPLASTTAVNMTLQTRRKRREYNSPGSVGVLITSCQGAQSSGSKLNYFQQYYRHL
jgi:hypothetical protein